MPEARASQAGAEGLHNEPGQARASQAGVEGLETESAREARVSQAGAEGLQTQTNREARVSQAGIEGLYLDEGEPPPPPPPPNDGGHGGGPHTGISANNPCTPNVLWIAPDSFGQEQVKTFGTDPSSSYADLCFIGRLLTEAVRFKNAYALTDPAATKAAYLTGSYAHRTGVGTLPQGPQQTLIHEAPSMTDLLRYYDPSFRAGVFGLWNVATKDNGGDVHPLRSGFDKFVGMIQRPDDAGGSWKNWRRVEAEIVDGKAKATVSRCKEYAITHLVDEVLAWMNGVGPPQFAFFPTGIPGAPLQRPPAHLYDTERYVLEHEFPEAGDDLIPYYKAAQQALDKELERLFLGLEQTLKSNLVIIFAPCSGTPGELLPVGFDPTHGEGTAYEQGVKIPMFVWGIKTNRGGREHTGLVAPYDHYKTLTNFSVTGLQLLEPQEGFLYARALSSTTLGLIRQTLLLEQFAPNGYHLAASRAGSRSIRDSLYKLLRHTTGTTFPHATDEFYDLTVDPLETTNLTPGGASGGLSALQLAHLASLRAAYILAVNLA